MELDKAPAPTSRLDHLAELATSPTHAHGHHSSDMFSPVSSTSSSTSRHPSQDQYTTHHPLSRSQEDSRSLYHSSEQEQQRPLMKETGSSSTHHHSRPHSSRPLALAHQLETESGWGRSPITPTTTRKFNRMAIHEVLENQEDLASPSFKRKGSPDESLMEASSSRSPSSSASRLPARGASSSDHAHHSHSHSHSHSRSHSHSHSHGHRLPLSPRPRQESPLPASNSEDDEDPTDVRNFKKRRTVVPAHGHSHGHGPHSHLHKTSTPLPSSPGIAPAEVMDQVRSTLKLKQQQKAIIEARQNNGTTPPASAGPTSASTAPTSTSPTHSSPQKGSNSTGKTNNSGNGSTTSSSQPITEKTTSGISVFHGSASFAAMNRRGPLVSPKNPKNAKSLTIFAPSYSESSLSIHSAPLQPSHAHQLMSGSHPPRTSNPLRNHTPMQAHHPHPLSHQHHGQQQQTGGPHSHRAPRSPTTGGHGKSLSRALLRGGPHTAGLDNSSGTIPAPILSSHTGPLPSPMYPHPSTPFHPAHSSNNLNIHLNGHGMSSASATAGGSMAGNKAMFMETVSTLFDSVDSTRTLKLTLEEQIRKSAQLLQTLQSSGTMIESLVRGQFKELEKGVFDRFESEIEYLSMRVGILEKHQGLTAPPPPPSTTTTPVLATQSISGKRGATIRFATAGSNSHGPTSLPSPPSASSNSAQSGTSPLRHSSKTEDVDEMKEGTLPTPPLNKKQDSLVMELDVEEENQERSKEEERNSPVEDEDEAMGEEEPVSSYRSSSASAASPPSSTTGDYNASVKKLQERIAKLEKGHEANAAAAASKSATTPEPTPAPLTTAVA
ncbi:hypothetical protein EMPS_10560 [Entomortierella parvispora]|uniref:Uncharacterized protein n=1 Tax=Entomortierella parvispora TaxID=205924 RepID=A0A9P3HKD1_9FUNG|nr:hypothetical protein EMPS_10560 [Entomortierella parvispora]